MHCKAHRPAALPLCPPPSVRLSTSRSRYVQALAILTPSFGLLGQLHLGETGPGGWQTTGPT